MSGVVIAGGGLAAQRCAETLRRVGYEGSVRIVCGEPHRPYDRPPLSKEVLLDAGADAGVPLRAADWYDGKAVELLLGVRASGLDADARRLALEDGRELDYEHLVVATGARPRLLPAFAGHENVSTLRTFEDAQRLRALLAARARLLIVGAGFIGQEVAAAARAAGTEVTIVEAERLPLVGLLGELIGGWFAELHRHEGVELLLETTVDQIHGERTVEAVTFSDGRRLECDHVLVGIGVRPDLAWVEGSGLPTDGIPTDTAGRSVAPRRLRGRRCRRVPRPLPRAPCADRPLGGRGAPGRRGRQRDRRHTAGTAGALVLLERPVRDPHPVPRPRASRRRGRDRRRSRRA